MPDRYLRQRAAQLIIKESRYRFPPWLRFVLIGFAAGLVVGALACQHAHHQDPYPYPIAIPPPGNPSSRAH